ncbi:MAG: hypothetical protein SGILL_010636 [Bacillariaceae sp.]
MKNFGSFLSNRPATNYTLRMKPAFNMQFTVLDVMGSGGSKENAFVVIGFQGFDESVNVKPTLGARLTKINGIPIGPKCSLESLQNALYGKSNSKVSKSLTFRNDEWDAEQKKALDAAIAATTATTKSESTKNKADSGMSLEEQQPRSRSRAGSAEAVGKAIGSFLHNVKQHSNSDKPERKNT